MHDAHRFLEALALVLVAAAATAVLCRLLRQPVVLGYILAGLLVGPHVAFPLFADVAAIQTLSELGVILLMFALGLEFRVGKLFELGPEEFTPGTKMPLQKMTDRAQRDALIAYLEVATRGEQPGAPKEEKR